MNLVFYFFKQVWITFTHKFRWSNYRNTEQDYCVIVCVCVCRWMDCVHVLSVNRQFWRLAARPTWPVLLCGETDRPVHQHLHFLPMIPIYLVSHDCCIHVTAQVTPRIVSFYAFLQWIIEWIFFHLFFFIFQLVANFSHIGSASLNWTGFFFLNLQFKNNLAIFTHF